MERDQNIKAWIKHRVKELHSRLDESKSDLLIPLKDSGAITRWLKDDYPPQNAEIETIERLAKHFGMTVFEFFGFSEPAENEDLIQDLRLVLSFGGKETVDVISTVIRAAARPIRIGKRNRDGPKAKSG